MLAMQQAQQLDLIDALARRGLSIQKQIDMFEQQLEQLKPIFRNHGKTIVVRGIGKVKFSRAVEAHAAYDLDTAKFLALPTRTRKRLIAAGVITPRIVKRRAAAIQFELNV